jgi:hypothetical protein
VEEPKVALTNATEDQSALLALETERGARAAALEAYPIGTSAPNSSSNILLERRRHSHARDPRRSLAAHRPADHAARSKDNRAMKISEHAAVALVNQSTSWARLA